MRVAVTGGTGFVGSHTVAALVRHGHEVRVLARRPEAVPEVLGPLGVAAEAVRGDVTDADTVAAALDGCDAVLHAAAHIGVSSGAAEVGDVNVDGTRNVVARAVATGMDPIVFTSSVSIFLPSDLPLLTPASPMSEARSPYTTSKQQAELLVRRFQADGHPVVSVALGGVYGPNSPNLDSSFAAVLGALGTLMLVPPGGTGIVDVRDAAELLARAMRPGQGPRRYLAGGRHVSWAEWVDLLSEGAGTPVARAEVTVEQMVALGREFDDQRRTGAPVDVPLTEEAALVMTQCPPTDDSATLADLGHGWRPVVDTFRDTVTWLRAEGHLPPPS